MSGWMEPNRSPDLGEMDLELAIGAIAEMQVAYVLNHGPKVGELVPTDLELVRHVLGDQHLSLPGCELCRKQVQDHVDHLAKWRAKP